jgi:hypothetical protein
LIGTRAALVARMSDPLLEIESLIYVIRGRKVMLDRDLALLYGVTTSDLNKAVFRNRKRFPVDFMFQLTKQELTPLRFQFGISKVSGRGGRRTPPYVFTQEGVAMLSGVLKSDRAILVNIAIMRAFVKIREMLAGHDDLARRLAELEERYDVRFRAVFEAIRELMSARAVPRKRVIGLEEP